MSSPAPTPLDPKERAELYVELWKQTVQVQMHFTDTEMKIRTAAITVLTFVLGAAAVALKDGTSIEFFGSRPPLATIVLALGCVLWAAFYFVDQWWYHPLLKGAVTHGEDLEVELQGLLPKAGLTKQIRATSPTEYRILWGRKRSLHSDDKMNVFYGIIFALLAAASVVTWLSNATAS